MPAFTEVTIIYNPHSTGPSDRLAKDMQQALLDARPKWSVKLVPTKYAGHAEELAYEHAKASPRPLIISSSGDGGYHEVVNGIMRAQLEGAKATAGLLPGGNANDHYHSLHTDDFVTAVVKNNAKVIDLLKFEGVRQSKPLKRYAHSYIGLGLSPKIGRELNKNDLNRFVEARIVVKTLLRMKHTRVKIQGKTERFDSLVFTNVGRMAKILNLANESDVSDGKFEVSAIAHHSSLRLFSELIRASTVGSQSLKQTRRFSFWTTGRTSIQLDGEIRKLDPRTKATVTIEHHALRCIV